MSQYREVFRGTTPEGIRFSILQTYRGREVVSIDIESVWKVQDAKRRKHATTVTPLGGTPYHKRQSKLRGDA